MASKQSKDAVCDEIETEFRKMDTGGDGCVSLPELRKYCERVPGMEGIAQAFCEIDTSDDQKITLQELRDFINDKCDKDKINDCHLTKLFNQLDSSRDGKLDKKEFSKLLCSVGFDEDEITKMTDEVSGGDGLITLKEFLAAFHA